PPIARFSGRRKSVFAETYNPEDDDDDDGTRAVFPKTDEQRQRLAEAVRNILLFRALDKDQMQEVIDAMFERKVQEGEINSGSFGELALMYNMPRAATIKAASEGSLWAMDRQTFRRIVLKSAFKKRKMYETLIESVPMLKTLQPYERMNLADALVPSVLDDSGKEVEINRTEKGGYFGELALVTHRPRAASAYAQGDVKCACK
ncbi:unnamed protein product, partial [Acanthoscelides obtectus]